MINGSPPCRSVLVCAEALGLKLEQQQVDLLGGEHRKQDFLKVIFFKQFAFASNNLQINLTFKQVLIFSANSLYF